MIFKNKIYVKAQVQIVQNIQIWLPMRNNRWGGKISYKKTPREGILRKATWAEITEFYCFFLKAAKKKNACQDKHSPFLQEEKDWQSETLITKQLLLS